ncbi:unnamed protein product, partial [marine sediment metagenome]
GTVSGEGENWIGLMEQTNLKQVQTDSLNRGLGGGLATAIGRDLEQGHITAGYAGLLMAQPGVIEAGEITERLKGMQQGEGVFDASEAAMMLRETLDIPGSDITKRPGVFSSHSAVPPGTSQLSPVAEPNIALGPP